MCGTAAQARDTSNDFALLVGVNDYPHAGYPSLRGPPNDVVAMKEWLERDDGGHVPAGNIKVLLSPNPTLVERPKDYPPTDRQAWDWLESQVFDAAQQPIRRPTGRLYLYFSGHGFSSFLEKQNHAALFMANATPLRSPHVCGTFMAQWCVRAAMFGEVVLVMDCCRAQEVSKTLAPAVLDEFPDPGSKNVKLMEIYAVPYAGSAQERPFKRHGGVVFGILTYALLEALRSAPTDGGARTGSEVKKFVERTWASIVGQDRVEAPEVVLPKRGDIIFNHVPAARVRQTLRFAPPMAEPCTLEVADGDGQIIDAAHLDPATGRCEWTRNGATSGFDGQSLVFEHVPGVFEATLKRPDKPDLAVTFDIMGERDVVFEL